MNLPDSVLELANRAAAGDDVALTVLLTELELPLRRRLERRVPADLRAAIGPEDLLQQVYADVFGAIRQFRPQDSKAFDRWLATIALRRLRAEIRRLRATKRGGGRRAVQHVARADESAVSLLRLIQAADRTPSRVAATRESVEAVAAALEQLPGDYREAVRLIYLEGLSVAEAAQRMVRTDRAIHNLCFKARQHLRELLGSDSGYFSSS